MILGLGYRARSGKDTFADYLCAKHDFRKAAFALALKEAARCIFGLSIQQLYGDQKEVIDDFWGLTPRNILQRLGTEACRSVFGDAIWVMALKRYLDKWPPGTRWVITDMRFPNEAEAIKQWGGLLVRIDRPGAGASGGVEQHPSETAMENFERWDAVVHNEGTLAQLYAKADFLVSSWMEEK